LASSCGAASSCLNASCSGCSGKTHMALSFYCFDGSSG
jgi:hypothetical protein